MQVNKIYKADVRSNILKPTFPLLHGCVGRGHGVGQGQGRRATVEGVRSLHLYGEADLPLPWTAHSTWS